jgi:hypothetical protein
MRDRPRQPEPTDEPRHDRQVTVARERAAPLDLGDPSERLGVQEICGAQQLPQIRLQPVVIRRTQIVCAELVDRGPERAHGDDATEQLFDGL